MSTNRYCTEAKGFDPSEAKFGLTCGYWTNVPKNLDNHIIKHHFDDSDLYDLSDEQYAPTQEFITTNLPGGGIKVEVVS